MLVVLFLAAALVLVVVAPGSGQEARSLYASVVNGNFEGDFYDYGSGRVAVGWTPYNAGTAGTPPPQYLRSTLYRRSGAASQQIWTDRVPWYAGIKQTIGLDLAKGDAAIQAAKRYTVRVWVYSIYAGASSAVQDGKILKRLGVSRNGGTDPSAADILWTPWHGQDKTWVQINWSDVVNASTLTIFIEGWVPTSGGQDQLYIDDVIIEEEGGPAPTRTPTTTPTRTPVPTATPQVSVVRTLSVGRQPLGIAVMPRVNRFLVANAGDNTVSSLEGFLNWQHNTFSSEGQAPSYVATDPERCRLYVVNSRSESLAIFDPCLDRHIKTLMIGPGKAPEGVAVLNSSNKIFVANAAAGSVTVIDGETLTVQTTVPVDPLPGAIAANPVTNKVFVACRGYSQDSGSVIVIDGTTLTTSRIGLSFSDQMPAPAPNGIAVNALTNRVFVAAGSGVLAIIDGASHQVLALKSPPIASGLSAVAVNPATNHVFVSAVTGNKVFTYDADAATWLATTSVGSGLQRAIAVNPLTNDVMVSNPADNTVSVIRDFGFYQPVRLHVPLLLK